MTHRTLLLTGMISLLTVMAGHAQAVDVCQNGTFQGKAQPWGRVQNQEMIVKFVKADGLDGIANAVEADIKTPNPKASYRCGLYQTVNQFIPKGSPIKLTFQAKGTPGKQIRFNIQTYGTPWDNTLTTNNVKLTDAWKTYTFRGKAKRDYAAGGLRIYVVFGQDAGKATLTDIQLDIDGASDLAPIGKTLNANANFTHGTSGWGYNKKFINAKVLKEDGRPYMQLTLKNVDPKKPWLHNFSQRTASKLPKGTKLKMVAILRSPTANAKVDLYYQGKDGYKERLMLAPGIKLTKDWQTVELNATMPRDYDCNDCGIMMLMSYREQVIEIQSITLSIVD